MLVTHRSFTAIGIALALTLVVGACGNAPLLQKGEGAGQVGSGRTATDAEALAQAATRFDSISSELKMQFFLVDAVADSLAGQMRGSAGAALQDAWARFREASSKHIQVIDDIAQHISQAGIQYKLDDPEIGAEKWDFGGTATAADEIRRATTTVDSLLDEGRDSVVQISGAWDGGGSAAFEVVLRRWDANASALRDSLRSMVRAVEDGGMRP